MAKKRSCRRSEDENKAHEFAVGVRKKTDAQIYEAYFKHTEERYKVYPTKKK